MNPLKATALEPKAATKKAEVQEAEDGLCVCVFLCLLPLFRVFVRSLFTLSCSAFSPFLRLHALPLHHLFFCILLLCVFARSLFMISFSALSLLFASL